MKTFQVISYFVFMCLGSFFFCTAVFGQYQFIDLGVGQAYSINNNGQIVGESNGQATLFDPMGAGNNVYLGGGCAYSINNNGQIVGWSNDNAILFDPTGMGNNIDLGVGSAFSINNNGQSDGWRTDNTTLFDSTGSGNNIFLGGIHSVAYSINDKGQIVGSTVNNHGNSRAILFDPTGMGNNIDLGVLPIYPDPEENNSKNSLAYSINNKGQIVGECYFAALFDPTGGGNNINIETMEGYVSYACSINNNGQIVGAACGGNESVPTYAKLYDPTGAGNNIILNAFLPERSTWILTSANFINDNGWIVGGGYDPSGYGHAFLLKPIPEPCTLCLLALGGLALLRKRR
jgi:probable HAF family extracellular repeat protein